MSAPELSPAALDLYITAVAAWDREMRGPGDQETFSRCMEDFNARSMRPGDEDQFVRDWRESTGMMRRCLAGWKK